MMTSIPLSCGELVAEFGAYAAALAHVYMACARALQLFEAIAKHAQSGNLYARVHVHKFFA